MRLKVISILVLLLCAHGLRSQNVAINTGTDFWLGFMKNYDQDPAASLEIYIHSDQATAGVVEIPGSTWMQYFSVTAGATSVVNVPNSVAEMLSNQQIESKGIHISSEAPVSVSAANLKPTSADATAVVPTSALGTSYIVASYSGYGQYASEILIVASADNTEIEIIPTAATLGGNPAGVAITISLQRGNSYQLRAAAAGDLTGTVVRATNVSGTCRPFALFSGVDCANVPTNCTACDHLFEQNFPIEYWGTDYYITPWIFDLNPDYNVSAPNYAYRILASQSNTTITIDGSLSITLGAGEFQEFTNQQVAHCIVANKKIAVIQYMEGIACGGNGDPAMLILQGENERLNRLAFNTNVSSNFNSHYLNIVLDAVAASSLLFDGAPLTNTAFLPLAACPDKVWCAMQLSPGGHLVEMNGAGFNAYFYGIGESESYAYSAGVNQLHDFVLESELHCTNSTMMLEMPVEYENTLWYHWPDSSLAIALGNEFSIDPPIVNGIYLAVATNNISGCTEHKFFIVESPDALNINLSPADNLVFCASQSIQLNAQIDQPELYDFAWSPNNYLSNATLQNPIATPVSNVTYVVSVESKSGCAAGFADITLLWQEGRVTHFEATASQTMLCSGQSSQLNVVLEKEIWGDDFDPGVSWGDWELIENANASALCGASSGDALYFNGIYPRQAITNSMDVSVGGNIYFSLKIADGIAPCDNAEPGDNVIFSYSVNNGPWIDIVTFNEANYPNITPISLAIPAGAMSTATRFKWRQGGSYAANQDNWVLDNISFAVSAPDEFNYQWSPALELNDASIVNPLATPSGDVTYVVTTTDNTNGCSYMDSIVINVGIPFTVTTGDDVLLCDIAGVELFAAPAAPGNYSYAWSPDMDLSSAFSSHPVATPSNSTVYQVVATSEEGCTAEGEINITVSELLDLIVNASSPVSCQGAEIILTATLSGDPEDVSYQWTPASGLANPQSAVTTVQPTEDEVYVITVTHIPSGCSVEDSVLVAYSPGFNIAINTDSVIACTTEGIHLVGNTSYAGELDWSWSPGYVVTGATEAATFIALDISTELLLTATDENGCEAADSVVIVLQEENTDLGADTGFCEGQSLLLNAGWPTTYTVLWNTGAETPTLLVSEAGSYSVQVTNPDGCFSNDTILVSTNAYPLVDLGTDTVLCAGEFLTLYAGADGTAYVWNNGSQNAEIDVVSSGNYSVVVSNDYCESSDAISVLFQEIPVVNFPAVIQTCLAFYTEGIALNAGNAGTTFIWNTGASTKEIFAYSPGIYTVEIIGENGCAASYSTEIINDCPATLFAPNSFTPDGDGLNDVWMVKGQNIANYRIKIYNRWGELFFESEDIDEPWLGQRRNGDHYLETGVYSYLITYKTYSQDGTKSDEIKSNGNIILAR